MRIFKFAVAGQEKDLHIRIQLPNLLRRIQPGQTGHPDVREKNVHTLRFRTLNCLKTVFCGRKQCDAVFLPWQGGQSAAQHLLVLRNQKLNPGRFFHIVSLRSLFALICP